MRDGLGNLQPLPGIYPDYAAPIVRAGACGVVVLNVDRYSRTVGQVHVGPVDVNAELVRDSQVWVTGST